MDRFLTSKEHEQLLHSHRHEKNPRVRDRIKAVLAYDEGYTYSDIAKILLLDDETIRRHIEDYFSKHKLAPENGGSQSYLNEEESVRLKTHLEEKIYLYVKEICFYVKQTFKKLYSISGMTKWLRANGFRYKKPHGVPAKADLQKQAEFMAHYESLKANKGPDEVIYFGDCTHPQHQTRLAFGWIKKGVRKAAKMTACQKRINIIGAIDIESHQIVTQEVDWVTGESLKGFAKALLKANPRAKIIHWFLDNAGPHKNKAFLEWLSHTKIKLHYLPAYSPNLNPIERLWKVMHECVTYNRYYEKFLNFKDAIMEFFRGIKRQKKILRARITDNFQTLVAT